MKCYIITYDIYSDIPNYDQKNNDMIEAIKDPAISYTILIQVVTNQVNEINVASTSYVIKSHKDAVYIKDFLLNKIGNQYIKKLFVAHITKDAAWHGLSKNETIWLNQYLKGKKNV